MKLGVGHHFRFAFCATQQAGKEKTSESELCMCVSTHTNIDIPTSQNMPCFAASAIALRSTWNDPFLFYTIDISAQKVCHKVGIYRLILGPK